MIWTFVIGLIVGVIARLIMPGKEAFPDGILGWVLTAALGIIGAWLGTFIGASLWGGANYMAGWIMSILGAILLLVLLRLVMGSRSR